MFWALGKYWVVQSFWENITKVDLYQTHIPTFHVISYFHINFKTSTEKVLRTLGL